MHAHVGWLFVADAADVERYAPDIVRDPGLMRVSRLFPPIAIASLALPFFLGWALSGNMTGALSALLWAGVVRMALLHHVTWSVNSVCHMFGTRPFATNDQSTNVAALGLLSMGESWHNAHHAFPSLARHGVDRRQIDLTAACIRVWERLGLVHSVHWPDATKLALRRISVAVPSGA